MPMRCTGFARLFCCPGNENEINALYLSAEGAASVAIKLTVEGDELVLLSNDYIDSKDNLKYKQSER